ncbi:MAG: arylamine N-acetyltransferase family protein [Desulfococcaceae bacterium]
MKDFPFLSDSDLSAYLKRIGYRGDLSPTLPVLEAIHLAHATHIPFENLDILSGRSIRIDLSSIVDKLVRRKRGGYCFEQNLLLYAVLRKLGFEVTPLAARVRYRTEQMRPRTHMLLKVAIDGVSWLTDVGFGAEGLMRPLRLAPDEPARQFAWTYRLVDENEHWVLQSHREGSWIDLYAFSLEPQEWIDYHMANYYTSTHPDSMFVQILIAQHTQPEARRFLRNYELITDDGQTVSSRTLVDDGELLKVLDQVFGLAFPPGTRFRI